MHQLISFAENSSFTHITGASCVSSLGTGLKDFKDSLKTGLTGIKSSHRYEYLTSVPLGEVDFMSLDIPENRRSDPDEVILHMAGRVIDEINDSTGLFRRYKPSEIGIFIGTTTYGLRETMSIAGKFSFDDFLFHMSSRIQHARLI
ncbi:MAG: hypothetical protein HQK54_04055, partial [Oligoflexales bacterium]|nr:hypothetical protein [Oligoflexales bacterium]